MMTTFRTGHLGYILTLLLWAVPTVQAQFQVHPMRLAWTAVSGEHIEGQLSLINQSPYPTQARVTVIDLGQNQAGQWIPVEDANESSHTDLHYPRTSCRSWISLPEGSAEGIHLQPRQDPNAPPTQHPLHFCVHVPSSSTGSHLAALKITFQGIGTLGIASLNYDFIVPVVVDVLPAQSQDPLLPIARLVSDITLTPARLTRQARPGEDLSLALHLRNQHPKQPHTVSIAIASQITDRSGIARRTWIHQYPKTPETIEPNQAKTLKLGLKIPDHARGNFDTTVTITLSPQDPNALDPVLIYEMPLHLDISTNTPTKSTPTQNPSILRFITPRPFDLHHNTQDSQIHGTLAVYTTEPLFLEGSHRNSPWHLTAQPELIRSMPLIALYGEGPPWDVTDLEGLPPILLTLRPALP